MFKKSNRLTTAEFSELYRSGKKKHFPHLSITLGQNSGTKVSVVAGKKVAKSAVRRNLLKRRVYSILRKMDEQQSLGEMIVILKPTFSGLARKTAEEIVRQSIAEVKKSA
tara:strand:- start:19921 stop:20250 length:330 start_codon:yes stop_codon:yes gene_type:complete